MGQDDQGIKPKLARGLSNQNSAAVLVRAAAVSLCANSAGTSINFGGVHYEYSTL
jgi:hypothetical protein